MMLTSPAIVRVPRKTLWHPSAHKGLIGNALLAARGLADVIPVTSPDGFVLGLVGGSRGLNHTRFRSITHRQWCGFTSYADLQQEIARGKFYEVFFRKDGSGVTTANRWNDLWPCGGIPTSGTYSGTDTLRQFDASSTGAPYLPLAGAGETRHLIGVQATIDSGSTSTNTQAILYDRVASYDGGAISNATRTMTNTLSAQRYVSAGQSGLQIMVTCQSAAGVTASALSSMNYTDNDGNAASVPVTDAPDWLPSAPSPTATVPAVVMLPHNATASITWGPFMPLAAGDTGVRSITDYLSTATNTATVSMALVKPLGLVFSAGLSTQRVDFSQSLFGLERLYDGACLSAVVARSVSTGTAYSMVLRVAYG